MISLRADPTEHRRQKQVSPSSAKDWPANHANGRESLALVLRSPHSRSFAGFAGKTNNDEPAGRFATARLTAQPIASNTAPSKVAASPLTRRVTPPSDSTCVRGKDTTGRPSNVSKCDSIFVSRVGWWPISPRKRHPTQTIALFFGIKFLEKPGKARFSLKITKKKTAKAV